MNFSNTGSGIVPGGHKPSLDTKKCANQRERPFDIAVMLAIAEYRYDISAKHYLDGYGYLYDFAADGRAFGDCPLKPGWGERIMPPDEMRWTRVFHQIEGAPVTKGLKLLPGSPALNRAAREIVQAKQVYRQCVEKFGTRFLRCWSSQNSRGRSFRSRSMPSVATCPLRRQRSTSRNFVPWRFSDAAGR